MLKVIRRHELPQCLIDGNLPGTHRGYDNKISLPDRVTPRPNEAEAAAHDEVAVVAFGLASTDAWSSLL
jgi:hypothetical protein